MEVEESDMKNEEQFCLWILYLTKDKVGGNCILFLGILGRFIGCPDSWGKFSGTLDSLVCEVHLDMIKSSMVLGNCLVLGSLMIMEK